MQLEAIYNAVIVKPIELENTGNIIIPDIGNGKNEFGEVVSVGPGAYSNTGDLIPTQLKVGDLVLLPTMGLLNSIGKVRLITQEEKQKYQVATQKLQQGQEFKSIREVIEEFKEIREQIKSYTDAVRSNLQRSYSEAD